MSQFFRDQIIAKEFAVGDRETNSVVAEAILDDDGNVTGYSFPARIPTETPINGTASSVVIDAAEFALLVEGDTVLFDGNTFTFAAYPEPYTEFSDAEGLAALINALDGWTAVEAAGAITITAAESGDANDGEICGLYATEDVTAGGDGAGTVASATITAESLLLLEAGDMVMLLDEVFTKVASDPGDDEFATTEQLATLINAITGWSASVVSGGDIEIVCDTDVVTSNGYPVVLLLRRTTAGGIDATTGVLGQTYFDATYLYICVAVSEAGVATWMRLTLESF